MDGRASAQRMRCTLERKQRNQSINQRMRCTLERKHPPSVLAAGCTRSSLRECRGACPRSHLSAHAIPSKVVASFAGAAGAGALLGVHAVLAAWWAPDARAALEAVAALASAAGGEGCGGLRSVEELNRKQPAAGNPGARTALRTTVTSAARPATVVPACWAAPRPVAFPNTHLVSSEPKGVQATFDQNALLLPAKHAPTLDSPPSPPPQPPPLPPGPPSAAMPAPPPPLRCKPPGCVPHTHVACPALPPPPSRALTSCRTCCHGCKWHTCPGKQSRAHSARPAEWWNRRPCSGCTPLGRCMPGSCCTRHRQRRYQCHG